MSALAEQNRTPSTLGLEPRYQRDVKQQAQVDAAHTAAQALADAVATARQQALADRDIALLRTVDVLTPALRRRVLAAAARDDAKRFPVVVTVPLVLAASVVLWVSVYTALFMSRHSLPNF